MTKERLTGSRLPHRDLGVWSPIQLLLGNGFSNKRKALEKLVNKEDVEGGPGDTGEVLSLLPASFQYCGAYKRDISYSFPSSFLSLGHETATQ